MKRLKGRLNLSLSPDLIAMLKRRCQSNIGAFVEEAIWGALSSENIAQRVEQLKQENSCLRRRLQQISAITNSPGESYDTKEEGTE